MSCYLRQWLPETDAIPIMEDDLMDEEVADHVGVMDEEVADHVGAPMWTNPPLVMAEWLRAKQTSPTLPPF